MLKKVKKPFKKRNLYRAKENSSNFKIEKINRGKLFDYIEKKYKIKNILKNFVNFLNDVADTSSETLFPCDPILFKSLKFYEWLNSSAIYDNFGNVFWKNQFTKENNVFGLGYGAAGVALFLLRLYELVGDDRIRYLGEKAINSEMNKSKLVLKNLRSFSNGKNYEPYLEEGTAGVLKVALRYNLKNKIFEELLNDLRRKYFVLPGYLFGTAGIIDTLLDIILIDEKKIYLRF